MSKSAKINSIKFDLKNVRSVVSSVDRSSRVPNTLTAEYAYTSNEGAVGKTEKTKITYDPNNDNGKGMLKIRNDDDAYQDLIFREIKLKSGGDIVAGCGISNNPTDSSHNGVTSCLLEFEESTTGQGIDVVISAESSLWD